MRVCSGMCTGCHNDIGKRSAKVEIGSVNYVLRPGSLLICSGKKLQYELKHVSSEAQLRRNLDKTYTKGLTILRLS